MRNLLQVRLHARTLCLAKLANPRISDNLHKQSLQSANVLLVSVKKTGGNFNEDFNKALDEMMENIKRGKPLRPTLRPVRKVAIVVLEVL